METGPDFLGSCGQAAIESSTETRIYDRDEMSVEGTIIGQGFESKQCGLR